MMTEEQFDDLKDLVQNIEGDTDDIYYVKTELESVNTNLNDIKDLLRRNNDLLQDLIDTVYSKD